MAPLLYMYSLCNAIIIYGQSKVIMPHGQPWLKHCYGSNDLSVILLRYIALWLKHCYGS